ncbi:MAG: glycoside hydrolase family 38 C-terminal domain-containing protein, partial [Bacteroidales bacterium]
THGSIPPALEVSINGVAFNAKLPAGGGDASIKGDESAGKPWMLEFPFHPKILREGTNQISLATRSGSWFLYDAVSLIGPEGLRFKPLQDFVLITEATVVQALHENGDGYFQDVVLSVLNSGNAFQGDILLDGDRVQTTELPIGQQEVRVSFPAVSEERTIQLAIRAQGQILATQEVTIKPVRRMTIYILPHSHTDIGYTEVQTAIEDKQIENLVTGMEYARQTAHYPEGARFIWNVEVGWAADLYLQRLGEEARSELLEALSSGQVGLNGMYLNVLTGLCRPEELLRLFRFSTQLEQLTGQAVDAAMISDVPGYTWGTVTAMAQAGIRYFSVAPNYFDRIGDILVEWENRPFYWVSPSGHEKVLVWIPLKGYAMSHIIKALTPGWVGDYANQLDAMGYPYDIAHIRWSGHGDNAAPDTSICGFVRDWNSRYSWPRFIISTTGEAFRAFEEKYGDQLPAVRGDWTPYWEDGAGSSALETALNRNSADRLTQAQMVWALTEPGTFPTEEFEEAWKKVLLYSEHTWGAWCSITDPENPMTVEQWAIKKSYADEAASLADELMTEALNQKPAPNAISSRRNKTAQKGEKVTFEVINSLNWKRGGVIQMSSQESSKGDQVVDQSGRVLRSQRLSTGEMAIECPEIEPFGQFRFSVENGKASAGGSVTVTKNIIRNNLIECEIDPVTGDIIRITELANGPNLVDTADGQAVNRYLFFEGNDNKNVKTSDQATIRIVEPGPLVGELEIISDAPGCHQLIRRIRLDEGAGHLVLTNTVDKERAPMPERTGDWFLAQNRNKESVNFAFPFNVPGGTMRLDLPLGEMVPWIDQIPSACKNWFTVGRWADVSDGSLGVTWISLDAPLVQVGELSAN